MKSLLIRVIASFLLTLFVVSCGPRLDDSMTIVGASDYEQARTMIGKHYWEQWSDLQLCDSPADIVCSSSSGKRYSDYLGPFTIKDVIRNPLEVAMVLQIELPNGQTKFLRTYHIDRLLGVDPGMIKAKAKAACDRKGGIHVGMTAEQVMKSCWGKPRRKNITRLASGVEEQWIYGSSYVYVTNGVITAIQTTE